IVAVVQRRARGKGPVTTSVDGRKANLRTVIHDVVCTTRLSGAADRRGGVVGDLPAGEVAGHAARGIVVNRIQRWNRWRRQVNHDVPAVRHLADVALWVGGGNGEGVRSFAERGVRGERPGTGAVSRDHGNLGTA